MKDFLLSPRGIFLCYLLLINLFTFLLFGYDKWRAKREAYRIAERTLFFAAILGGSPGAILGMRVFHHKTRHKAFIFGMPLILAAQILIPLVLFLSLRGAR